MPDIWAAELVAGGVAGLMRRALGEAVWSAEYGTYFEPGTVLVSHRYAESTPPPHVATHRNATVLSVAGLAVFDCQCLVEGPACQPSPRMLEATMCANNDMAYLPPTQAWVLVVGSLFSALLAFGIGANDAANSWATAVGSGAIRLRWGLLVGGGCDWLGAVALGHTVSTKIRGLADISDPDCYACGYSNSRMALYPTTMAAALVAASLVLMAATLAAMPVSTSQAVVAGVVGASLGAANGGCFESWAELWEIARAWALSPLLSGVLAAAAYLVISAAVLWRRNPRRAALAAVPACFLLSTAVTTLALLMRSLPTDDWPAWAWALACGSISTAVTLLAWAFVIPHIRRSFPSQRAVHTPLAPLREAAAEVQMAARRPAARSSGGDLDELAAATFDFDAIPNPARANRWLSTSPSSSPLAGASTPSTSNQPSPLRAFFWRRSGGSRPGSESRSGSVGGGAGGTCDEQSATRMRRSGSGSGSGSGAGRARSSEEGSGGGGGLLTGLWALFRSSLPARRSGSGAAASVSGGSTLASQLQRAATELQYGTAEEVLYAQGGSALPASLRGRKAFHYRQLDAAQHDAVWAFKFLLVYQAALQSFMHGANDTGNATGPLIGIVNSWAGGAYNCAQTSPRTGLMAAAGFFVFLGVNTAGHAVVRTLGCELADMNYLRGWCVEWGSTTAVMVATALGLPVSTTHCQVGAVVFVSVASFGPREVSWRVLATILLAWALTVPLSGGLAAVISFLFGLAVRR